MKSPSVGWNFGRYADFSDTGHLITYNTKRIMEGHWGLLSYLNSFRRYRYPGLVRVGQRYLGQLTSCQGPRMGMTGATLN